MTRYRECRERAGLSQKAAAISLGVKAPSMSDWENGKSQPSIEHLIAMAKLYGVSVDFLLGVETSQNVSTDTSEELQELVDAVPEESKPLIKGFVKLLADNAK